MIDVILWSPITRILHWAIALPVLFNFFLSGGDTLHIVLGYTALAALLMRLVWGLVTKDKAHFKNFPLSVNEIRNYSRTKEYPGHNPLASIVYILIWLLVGLLGVSGYMMGLDAFWGEEWLEVLHQNFSHALSGLVICHILGMSYDGVKHKRKTWLGMITGKRE